MSQPLIDIRNLSITLGEFAVHDASIQVNAGEYFVLLGPTGAGKTVVLECLAGLYRPERGDIYLEGRRINGVAPERRGLGYLPQDYALFPHLNVAGNIGFGMKLRHAPESAIASKTKQLAALLGITHLLHRSPIKLSGGERQRVALARALAIEPKVLLLDEPLSALDEQTREGLCVELRRVHKELGTTTVHVSHNFEETLMVADKIGILHQGRVQQVGTPEEVFQRPNSEFVARFVRSENIFHGKAARNGRGLELALGQQTFVAADGPEGDVCFTVRPEDVALTTKVLDLEPNALSGTVTRIVDRGALIRIDVDAGITVVSLVGRRAFQDSGLTVGSAVHAHFDPGAVHVFTAQASPAAEDVVASVS